MLLWFLISGGRDGPPSSSFLERAREFKLKAKGYRSQDDSLAIVLVIGNETDESNKDIFKKHLQDNKFLERPVKDFGKFNYPHYSVTNHNTS